MVTSHERHWASNKRQLEYFILWEGKHWRSCGLPWQRVGNVWCVSMLWRRHESNHTRQWTTQLNMKYCTRVVTVNCMKQRSDLKYFYIHYVSAAYLHDDVIKWEHFPRYWPFVQGIHRSPVNSTHKGRWRGALMFSLICVWIKGWVNNRDAGDLRRYRAHYDVTVMWQTKVFFKHE